MIGRLQIFLRVLRKQENKNDYIHILNVEDWKSLERLEVDLEEIEKLYGKYITKYILTQAFGLVLDKITKEG